MLDIKISKSIQTKKKEKKKKISPKIRKTSNSKFFLQTRKPYVVVGSGAISSKFV